MALLREEVTLRYRSGTQTTLLVQEWPKRWVPGLVNFVPAVACHFCLALPAEFTQPGDHLVAEPCNAIITRSRLMLDCLFAIM